MWKYQGITRKQFEDRKDFVESVLMKLGAAPIYFGQEAIISARTVFQYKNGYYRVDEVFFQQKPFIVIEWTDKVDYVIKNVMEDTDPFPFDLEDNKIIEYVKMLFSQ